METGKSELEKGDRMPADAILLDLKMEKGPQIKEHRWLLETKKGKERNSPLNLYRNAVLLTP